MQEINVNSVLSIAVTVLALLVVVVALLVTNYLLVHVDKLVQLALLNWELSVLLVDNLVEPV